MKCLSRRTEIRREQKWFIAYVCLAVFALSLGCQASMPWKRKPVRAASAAVEPSLRSNETDSVQPNTPPKPADHSSAFATHDALSLDKFVLEQPTSDPPPPVPLPNSDIAETKVANASLTAFQAPNYSVNAPINETVNLPASYHGMPADNAASSATESQSASFLLQVDNVRLGGGAVKVAVFTSADNFPHKQAAVETLELGDAGNSVTTTLATEQSCAIAVYQDLNRDGELTRNRLGIPVEPCGFSNNAVIRRGPPRFEDAVVSPGVLDKPTLVRIVLP